MRIGSLAFLIALFVAAPLHAAFARVVFVDNRAEPGGTGTADHPFNSLADGFAHAGEFNVVYVAETAQPYRGDFFLRRGQLLIGSAYGLDAVRSELHIDSDAPPTPAMRGPGPLIEGTVTLSGQNVVAGVSIATTRGAAISAGSPAGPLSVLNTNIRTANGALGISIGNSDAPVTITGGGLTAAGGGGIVLMMGMGDVVFDDFALSGTFTSAIEIRNRGGAVTFRGRGAIDVADATRPAVTIADCTGRVSVGVPLRVAANATALTIARAPVTVNGNDSRLETTGATALEIRDAQVDAAFAAISVTGGDRGVIVDKLRGTLAVSGGAIAGARVHGIEITQSAGVRLKGMTLTDDGSGDAAKCSDDVESTTNLRCGAALYLRHLSSSQLEDITITGGAQIGLDANNIEDVTFAGLRIRGAGDQPGEAAAVIDEAKGTIRFARCAFEDGAGGGVLVAQQFSAAKIVFDRCAFSAAGRPTAAPHLARFRAGGTARLDVEMRNVEMHDNTGAGLRAESAGTGTLNLVVADSRFERLGLESIQVAARDGAHAALTLRGTTILTPGNATLPAVDVSTAGSAAACADLIGNQVMNSGAVPAVRLAPGVGECHR